MESALDKKILKEIDRFKSIKNYIAEQDSFSALGGEIKPAPPTNQPPIPEPLSAPPPTNNGVDQAPLSNSMEQIPAPVANETSSSNEEVEELDISDLVNNQKELETKQKKYFQGLFNYIDNLDKKLSTIDQIFMKISELEQKFEKYRPKTPEEKLELRSLDSAPYKQNLRDFFIEKEPELEKTGKEYVLTSDDVVNFSPKEISDSFSRPADDDEIDFSNFKRS